MKAFDTGTTILVTSAKHKCYININTCKCSFYNRLLQITSFNNANLSVKSLVDYQRNQLTVTLVFAYNGMLMLNKCMRMVTYLGINRFYYSCR